MNLESIGYVLLGAMVTGGIAMVVSGSRMLQGIVSVGTIGGSPGMPTGLLLVIFGGVSFGLSAGYLIRDVQSDEWNEVID